MTAVLPPADAYRVAWLDETGPHHTAALPYADAYQRCGEVEHTLGCLAVHLLTETQFRAWVGDVARHALGAD